MKQLRNILLAAVVLAGFAGQALAAVEVLPRMRWNRGISSYGLGVTDSTRISIPGAAAAVDFADTTVWLDLGTLNNLAPQAYTGQNLVYFQINRQASGAVDSLQYQIQYTNDTEANATGFVPGTLTLVSTVVDQGDMVPLIPAVAPASTVTTAPLARFVRLVVYNSEVSATKGRVYFSVRPVIVTK